MPLPVAHSLLGATIVATTRKNLSFRKDWLALSLGATLAIIPDFDLILSWVLGYDVKTHGGFTHSIIFSLAAGLLACFLMGEKNLRGFTTYGLATLSHGILDVVTRKEFGGSALLWPVSLRKFRLGWFDYFEFYPSPATEPIIVILRNALEVCRYELMIFMPVFLFVVWLKRWQDSRETQERVKA
ncbi:MAG TPA: metal-dependent hydrolase [Blastocatellia bacterium]|nr:metal-dependent hydrolase [Blastocatellia bacterium]